MTGAALVEKDGTFVTANEAYCSILGYANSELAGKRFQEVTYPGDTEYDEEMASRVAAGQIESYTMTKRYVTKRSSVVWVRLRVDALRDGDGQFLCFLAQCHPLEPIPAAAVATPTSGTIPREVALLVWVKANWPVLLWVLSGLAAVLGYALQSIGKR